MASRLRRGSLFFCFGSIAGVVDDDLDAEPLQKDPLRQRRKSWLGFSLPFRRKSKKSSKKKKNKDKSDKFVSKNNKVPSYDHGKLLFSSDSSLLMSSSSSTSSSSSSSSSVLSSAYFTDPQIQTPAKSAPEKSHGGVSEGFLVLLLGLSVMIFCGRICAILSTASLLYFLRRRRQPLEVNVVEVKRPSIDVTSPESEEEVKRRVVMEGFLVRDRKW